MDTSLEMTEEEFRAAIKPLSPVIYNPNQIEQRELPVCFGYVVEFPGEDSKEKLFKAVLLEGTPERRTIFTAYNESVLFFLRDLGILDPWHSIHTELRVTHPSGYRMEFVFPQQVTHNPHLHEALAGTTTPIPVDERGVTVRLHQPAAPNTPPIVEKIERAVREQIQGAPLYPSDSPVDIGETVIESPGKIEIKSHGKPTPSDADQMKEVIDSYAKINKEFKDRYTMSSDEERQAAIQSIMDVDDDPDRVVRDHSYEQGMQDERSRVIGIFNSELTKTLKRLGNPNADLADVGSCSNMIIALQHRVLNE